jgi:hypothetical protein
MISWVCSIASASSEHGSRRTTGAGHRTPGDRQPRRGLPPLACPLDGGGYEWPEDDAEIYISRLRDPARAYAGSQWYRTFQTSEFLPWIRGEYADIRGM